MERWTELRTAYQVAKLGTVSAAARALGVHRATVNRHIDALEEELGAPIFIRNLKGYTLTELGEELLKVARKTDELFDDLLGRAKGRDGSIEGEIKITVIPTFTNMLMQPIANFRARNPNCQVTIVSSEGLQRLEYGEAHIALRAGPKPEHPDYVVQSFGSVSLNLYAQDSYFSNGGTANGVEDLEIGQFLRPPDQNDYLQVWRNSSEQRSRLRVAVATEDPVVAREAILAGLGLGILTEFDVADRDDVRALLPINEDWDIPLWLVTHVDLHRTEKVQEMLAHLKELLRSKTFPRSHPNLSRHPRT